MAIGQGDNDPRGTYPGAPGVPVQQRGVATGFGEAINPSPRNVNTVIDQAATQFAGPPAPTPPGLQVVARTASGAPATGRGYGSYGEGFNYGAATPETLWEAQRQSDLGATRGQALFNRGDSNASLANMLANRADTTSGRYQQQGFNDYGNSQFERNQGYEALDRLRKFYEQGPGPSAAEAQLQMAGDQNMANAIALSRSGRGAGQNAAAQRNAMFTNAATQQQLGGQTAVLRAQEAANWRQQQLGAMGLEHSTLNTMRGQDIASMGQNAQTGLGYGNLGLGYTQAGMQNQLGFSQLGSQQQMEGERLRQQILGQQLQANVQMRGQDVGYNASQSGDNNNAALWGGLGALGGGLVGLAVGGPAGAVVGAGAGSQIGQGAAGSDIRAKKNIQPVDYMGMYRQFKSLEKDSGKASAENPLAKEKPAERKDYGREAFDVSTVAPDSTFEANDRKYRVTDPGAPAPWEMPISPFAQQAPWQPFGQDPRLEQRTIPIDFSQGPMGPFRDSDREAKEQVRRETLRDVFGSSPTAALDAGAARQAADVGPRFDFRPAKGYSYEYVDPNGPGAAPGRHYGPMSKDLRKTAAGRSVVSVNPQTGMDQIDTGRLALMNTSAISEQQNKLDKILSLFGRETTEIPAGRQAEFDAWVKRRGIRDLDHPDSHYDYRGAFMAGEKAGPDAHWHDTFKQHGHPTFSNESQYARPLDKDFGYWEGDRYQAPLPPADLDAAYAKSQRDVGSRFGGRR